MIKGHKDPIQELKERIARQEASLSQTEKVIGYADEIKSKCETESNKLVSYLTQIQLPAPGSAPPKTLIATAVNSLDNALAYRDYLQGAWNLTKETIYKECAEKGIIIPLRSMPTNIQWE